MDVNRSNVGTVWPTLGAVDQNGHKEHQNVLFRSRGVKQKVKLAIYCAKFLLN
jgi:hypothetical protein